MTPVRERLLWAAMRLFTSRGYAATSVREIVEAAGVTKPALYYHFASKEGIFLALLDEVTRLADATIAANCCATGSARQRIERLFLGIFEVFERHKEAVRFINAAFWGPTEGRPPFDFESFHRKLEAAVQQIVVDGLATGELRAANPSDLCLALLGVLSFSMDLTLAHPELGLGKEGLRRALELLFAGLDAPARPPKETAS